jgi:V/A-type H+-transporting ATPase subunit F
MCKGVAEMYKIAVMGDTDSVLGFKALGLEVCPVSTPEEGREALHKMAKENYAIIYMTEQLAAQLQPDIARYQDALTPAIILIPGKEGSLGIGMANVKTAVERAVGADIL